MRIIRIASALACLLYIAIAPSAYAEEKLKKPNGEQIMFYSAIINASPATDKAKANQTLEKWMAGDLDAPKMSKASDEKGTGERAACIAACCGFLGCNPVCVAGCAML